MEKTKNISTGRITRKEWIYPSLIVALGFCYYISYIDYGISLSDEGFLVYGAERVLQGQLPMSDFSSYPPGSYFLLALLFKLFGVNLLVSRWMEMVFLLLNGLMVFYIGKRLMSRNMALIPSFILIAFPGPWHKVFFTFCLLLPLLSLLRFLEKRKRERILVLGGAIGIAILFKFESALYSVLITLIILFWIHTWKNGKFLVDRKVVSAFLKDTFLCSLGALMIVLPILAFYLSQSSLIKLFSAIRESYGVSNLGIANEYLNRPSFIHAVTKFHVGSLANLFFFLFLLLYLCLSVKVVIQIFVSEKKEMPSLLAVLLLGIFSLSYAYMVSGKSHLLQSSAIPSILFGYVMYTLLRKKGIKSKVAVIILVLLLGLYVADSFKWWNRFYSGSISRLYAIKKEGARDFSSPKGSVYVGKKELDILHGLINSFEGKDGYLLPLYYQPLVNFLTGLQNPTRFSILTPSYLNGFPKQKKVIDSIERFNIEYLLIPRILWTREGKFAFGNYAPLLYEYVMKQFPFEREVGEYLIFSRQPL